MVEKTMRSCGNIVDWSLAFNGLINTEKPCVAICCEPLAKAPAVSLSDSPEDIVKEFISIRNKLLEDISDSECAKNCTEYREAKWGIKDKIQFVNFSTYPSPCQGACIYCHEPNDPHWAPTDTADKEYRQIFKVIDYLLEHGYIDENAQWQIACGEITVHPFREKILDITKDKRVKFYSNCFIFDKDIATILATNFFSWINFSIDCGTSTTWRKIKRFDNFNQVIQNLLDYRACRSEGTSPITLKYIMLPTINDNIEDYQGVIDLMLKLDVKNLEVSRNFQEKYSRKDKTGLINSVVKLGSMLNKSGLSISFGSQYSPTEISEIMKRVELP